MRSARRQNEVGGFLEDAWNVLKAASPVVTAIDAVKDAAKKKEQAASPGAGAAAKTPDAPLQAQAKSSGVPVWVWFALFYLISKKA